MQKKVIYIRNLDRTWLDISDILFKEHNWKPVLWVGTRVIPISEALARFKELPCYSHADARRAIHPKELPDLSLAAVDAEILEKLSPNENEVFEMMSRLILGKDSFTYDERKHFYYNLLRIWVAILRDLEVDIVISSSVPHRIYDYVIYLICRAMGIEFLMIEHTNLPHLSYVISSISDRSRSIYEEYTRTPDNVMLDPETEEYLKKVQDSYGEGMPGYYRNQLLRIEQKTSLRKLYESFSYNLQAASSFAKKAAQGKLFNTTEALHFKRSTRNSTDIPERAQEFQMLLLQRKINIVVKRAEDWYEENAVKPDLTKPYVYFAANYQPERSTCPDAGVYYDLYLVLEILSNSIPDGWYIYYKEHPASFRKPYRFDNARDIQFYERIRKLPNCIFIDYKSNSFEMIDSATATAVAGSATAAWESVVRGVPSLELGDYWYSSCPGVFKVETVDECKKAFKKIGAGFKPDQKEVRRYLAAAEKICFDFQFRRKRDACFQDIEKDDPAEYKRRTSLLAKTLSDEYYRAAARNQDKTANVQPAAR